MNFENSQIVDFKREIGKFREYGGTKSDNLPRSPKMCCKCLILQGENGVECWIAGQYDSVETILLVKLEKIQSVLDSWSVRQR